MTITANHILTFIAALLLASQSVTHAADELVVYPPVPGLAASEHYKVRVRSAGDGSEWRSAFAWETGCKRIEKKSDAYFDSLAGWTHTYVNFETAGAVVIEIARVNGQPIRTAAVHPKRKASACSVKDGKVLVRLDQPCLVAVDIDGQMDGQDTGKDYKRPPIHTISRKPEFIFITGWNEWIGGRFLSDGTSPFLGRILPAGETFFVDTFSPEYSRDIEPMRGGFGDNYYWQMVAGIRRHKGARTLPAASARETIAIPGDFAQWTDAKPVYLDDLHDTTHRAHDGVAGAGHYKNASGRNDLDTLHVAHDAAHLFFHATTREPLTAATDADWMVLLIDTDQDAKTGWHGHDFRLNYTRPSPDTASIERWDGKAWQTGGIAKLQIGTNELHLAAERSVLGLAPDKSLRFDFKWTDNVPENAGAIDFLDHGDSAPTARFNYRYQTN